VESDHSSFELHLGPEVVPVELPLGGEHNVRNALAAAALALAAGIPPAAIRAGLEGVVMVAGRLTRHQLQNGAVIIDDSYNANPGSLRAAIDTLALEPGERWLVLGRMAELGPAAPELHAALGRHARAVGIDRLIAVGEWPTLAAREFGEGGESYPSREEAINALRRRIGSGVTVLVKGSRSSAMEHVVAGLLGRGTEASHAH
jgi:UDP-N-acetylmuramoyl-tripeptide--D-alanyl-D-alanine ligase